jgi:hypothetical protein
MLENFRDTYLELFYEYIDERLQEQNLILAHLVRYKHLADGKNSGTSSRLRTEMGSVVSLSTLYEYLYEQGIEFSIEPTSAAGEVDMIGIQEGPNRLLADIKIFDGAG